MFQLSLAENRLTEMCGVSHLRSLTVLNLANNSITCIEGEICCGLMQLSVAQWLEPHPHLRASGYSLLAGVKLRQLCSIQIVPVHQLCA